MTMSSAETLSQPSEAAGTRADALQGSEYSLAVRLSGFLRHRGDFSDPYRSSLDLWVLGVGPILTGAPRRESPRSRPDDDGPEATLRALAMRALTKEVVDLREEVASLRELVAPPALSVREQRRRHAELFEEFFDLAAQWREETAGYSVITPKVAHPAYLRIIGMGPVAVPWILRELEEHGGHWYVALRSITGANPVPHEDRGRIPKMRAAWLAWAREEGWID